MITRNLSFLPPSVCWAPRRLTSAPAAARTVAPWCRPPRCQLRPPVHVPHTRLRVLPPRLREFCIPRLLAQLTMHRRAGAPPRCHRTAAADCARCPLCCSGCSGCSGCSAACSAARLPGCSAARNPAEEVTLPLALHLLHSIRCPPCFAALCLSFDSLPIAPLWWPAAQDANQ